MIDWENIREECIKTGKVLKIPREKNMNFPPDVHEASLGISKGCLRQYRDEKPSNSLHIHEFEDYFLAHVDRFNPEHHPVAHGIVDTPGIAFGVLAGSVGLFFLMKKLSSLYFIPKEDREEDFD